MSNNRQIMSENWEKSLEDVYRNLFQTQEWKKNPSSSFLGYSANRKEQQLNSSNGNNQIKIL